MKTRSIRFLETLENRLCLSANTFIEHKLYESNDRPTGFFADIDGDGHQDVVSYSTQGFPQVTWMRGLAGVGFGARKTIEIDTTQYLGNRNTVMPFDFDSDGDVDIVSDNAGIILTENLGSGEFAEGRVLIDGSFSSFAIADIDADGDFDFVTTGDMVRWHENTNGQFISGRGIVFAPSRAVELADFDNDGFVDVAVLDYSSVYRFDANNSRFARDAKIYTDGGAFIGRAIKSADIDGDGWKDLVLVRQDVEEEELFIQWFRNVEGRSFESMQVRGSLLATPEPTPSDLQLFDVDQDGDTDVVFVNSGKLEYFENDGGKLLPVRPLDVGLRAATVSFANVNGRVEVLVGGPECGRFYCDGTLSWLTIGQSGEVTSIADLLPFPLSQERTLIPFDVDADGDLDILTGNHYGVGVFENLDGSYSEHLPLIYPKPDDFKRSFSNLKAIDFDFDGDPDLIARDDETARPIWIVNDGGINRQSRLTPVDGIAGSPALFKFADLDGDRIMDVLSISQSENGQDLVYQHGQPGPAMFSEAIKIADIPPDMLYFETSDVDSDGDTDIVFAFKTSPFRSSMIVVYNDTNGFRKGDPVGIGRVFESGTPVALADVDGDGDDDLLGLGRRGPEWWIENDNGRFGGRRTEISLSIVGWSDLDGDRDLDLIIRADDHLVWHAFDGGQFSRQRKLWAISTRDIADLVPADFDGDGDIDVAFDAMSIPPDRPLALSLFENRLIGDSNNDGVFDSADLVTVFAAAEYHDEIDGNSTFDEGDWNGDGDFTSADFVAAFQAGTYVKAARRIESSLTIDSVFANTELNWKANRAKDKAAIVP